MQSAQTRAFPLFGNDVEIFDFRPGRYMTEAPLHGDGEWAGIDRLYAALQAEDGIQLIRPSQVLAWSDRLGDCRKIFVPDDAGLRLAFTEHRQEHSPAM